MHDGPEWKKKGRVMSERGSRRRLSDAGLFFVTLVVTVVLCALWVAASADAADAWKVPRTADGQPDLQGVWTNATITPLERPKEFGDRLVITAAEAKTIESQNQQF